MAKLNDIFSDDMNAAGCGDLNILRLNETPVLVSVFTQESADLLTHYVAEGNVGEVQCNKEHESRCLLCDLENKAADRYLLALYVVRDDEVQILPITATCRPHSLGPQLTAEIRKGNLEQRYLRISRASAKYTIASVPAPKGHE
ncbi:unnamed protein product, partial [marine sediment metagenome]